MICDFSLLKSLCCLLQFFYNLFKTF